jgi:hypothetical protein
MLALPLLVYGAWYHDRTGVTGLTAADGWFLYGRVAEIADCSRFHVSQQARPLCEPLSPQARRQANQTGPAWYVFDPRSPAVGTFGGPGSPGANRILRSFALSVISSRPGSYARLVGRETMRFFTATSPRGRFAFLQEPYPGYSKGAAASQIGYVLGQRTRFIPGYVPRARAPAGALGVYEDIATLPPIGVGLFTAAALVALAVGMAPGGSARMPVRHLVALLTGMALLVLVGSAATSDNPARYLTPVMPLLLVAGSLGAAELERLARGSLGSRSRAARRSS